MDKYLFSQKLYCSMINDDVPSPIDLRLMRDAREWEQTVMAKRPWRTNFFARIGSELTTATPPVTRILELGSGPGFLAQYILQALSIKTSPLIPLRFEGGKRAAQGDVSTPLGEALRKNRNSYEGNREAPGDVSYVMLDFSAAMHQLAEQRLGPLAKRVEFIERDFKQPHWNDGLGEFDCVVTLQAVHELRHKRYAPRLHAQVRDILSPGGFYLVCDHYCGTDGMQNDRLYMTIEEQRDALSAAGFARVEELLRKGGMVLHACHI